MKKLKFISRLMAMVLSVVMLLGLLPLSALAAEGEDDVPLLGAMIDTNDEAYKNLNNAKAGLKAIATLSGYPGVGAVTDGVFGALFGSETEQIQAALAKISQQLDDIQKQMADLTEFLGRKIDIAELKDTLKTRIDKYTSVVPSYAEHNELFLARLAGLKEKDGETEEERNERLEAARDFYLYTVKNTKIKGEDFHMAVHSLGGTITMVDPSNGLDLFTAFDKLVLYSFNWEHHGYQYRVAFQSHVMTLYTNLSSISLAGLTVSIDEAEEQLKTMPEGTEKRKLKDEKATMETQRDNLKNQISKISNLADAHSINIRSIDERYYQVPGHELLLKATAVPKTVNPTYPNPPRGWVMNYDLFGGVLCDGDGMVKSNFKSKYNPTGYLPQPGDGKSAPYPTALWLMSVYKDYGGTKSLFDIFFGEDEGGIKRPNIIGLGDPNLSFVTSDWWFRNNYIQLNSGTEIDFQSYYMKLIDKSGKLREDNWLANVKMRLLEKDGIQDWNPNMMIGLILIPELKAGPPSGGEMKISGMAESYKAPYSKDILLSVEDKGELYTYEWQVDRDGHGFMPIDGANSASYALGTVDDSMNGYQYRCRIIHHVLDGDVETVTTEPVTLNLVKAGTTDNPQTGDNFPVVLLIILAGLSAVFVVIFSKKRQYKIIKK